MRNSDYMDGIGRAMKDTVNRLTAVAAGAAIVVAVGGLGWIYDRSTRDYSPKAVYLRNINGDIYPDMVVKDAKDKLHVYLQREDGEFVKIDDLYSAKECKKYIEKAEQSIK